MMNSDTSYGGVMYCLFDAVWSASSLSETQRLRLECAITCTYEEKFNCHSCLDAKRYTQDGIIQMRKKKGCDELLNRPICVMDSGYELYRCPGRMYDAFETSLIQDYQRLRDYHLLKYKGAIADQPAWWIDAMDFIRIECTKWDKILADRQEKKNDQHSHRQPKGRRYRR